VAAVFTPGASAASIVETIERHLQSRSNAPASLKDLADGDPPRKTRAAARLMTQLENDPASLPQVLRDYASTGRTVPRARMVLGITGAPGSGKSTLTGALVQAFRRRHPDERVGVIAVDPTSSITQGALLGDRVRMMHLSDDPKVFVRSLATRGHLGGLSTGSRGVMRAMELLGCGVILVETVGVGQNEAEIATLADLTTLVMAPGQGDGIQMLKAGVLEIADAVIINKSDQPDAQLLFEQVSAAQQMRREVTPGKPVHIALCSAVNGSGVDAVVEYFERAAQDHSAAWQARRT
jgi:LAO/AO transport system kinase